jgi:hypothetical protein
MACFWSDATRTPGLPATHRPGPTPQDGGRRGLCSLCCKNRGKIPRGAGPAGLAGHPQGAGQIASASIPSSQCDKGDRAGCLESHGRREGTTVACPDRHLPGAMMLTCRRREIAIWIAFILAVTVIVLLMLRASLLGIKPPPGSGLIRQPSKDRCLKMAPGRHDGTRTCAWAVRAPGRAGGDRRGRCQYLGRIGPQKKPRGCHESPPRHVGMGQHPHALRPRGYPHESGLSTHRFTPMFHARTTGPCPEESGRISSRHAQRNIRALIGPERIP